MNMKGKTHRAKLGLIVVSVAAVLVLGATGIALAISSGNATGFGNSYDADNDSVAIGSLATVGQSDATGSAGVAIKGTEEDAHQQDLIAGGNTGSVVSQNLPELTGIATVSSYTCPGDYTGVCPAIPHSIDDHADCISCHGEGGSAPVLMDVSHLKANLTNDNCIMCHQVASDTQTGSASQASASASSASQSTSSSVASSMKSAA